MLRTSQVRKNRLAPHLYARGTTQSRLVSLSLSSICVDFWRVSQGPGGSTHGGRTFSQLACGKKIRAFLHYPVLSGFQPPVVSEGVLPFQCRGSWSRAGRDRKSTRLNSSHSQISYAVFC